MLNYTILKAFYQSSPVWLKRIYGTIPFSLRAGKVYRQASKQLSEMEYADRAVIDAIQLTLLKKLLSHASRNVAYYREQFKISGIDPEKLQCLSQLQRLPFLTKDIVRANQEQLRALNVTEGAFSDNTGGSSGTPMSYIKSNSMYPKELAFMFDQWKRVDYSPGDAKLTLRGRAFNPGVTERKWNYNPIYNEILVSSYHLNEKTLRDTQPHVLSFLPKFIHGYPSAIVAYLMCLNESKLPLPRNIRAVLCGSEPLLEYQRKFIESTLGCTAYSWYGQSECVLLGGECEHSTDYHFYPTYGILELVSEDGAAITKPGIEGEIIGTSLNNYAMPFIRYRTGDRGILADGNCPCGRHFPRLRKVTGRTQHVIYTSARTAVPVTAFIFGQHFKAFEHIREMQLEQSAPGKLMIRLVTTPDFSSRDEGEMRRKMQSSVDNTLEIEFEYTGELKRNLAGKVDFVIQSVEISNLS